MRVCTIVCVNNILETVFLILINRELSPPISPLFPNVLGTRLTAHIQRTIVNWGTWECVSIIANVVQRFHRPQYMYCIYVYNRCMCSMHMYMYVYGLIESIVNGM